MAQEEGISYSPLGLPEWLSGACPNGQALCLQKGDLMENTSGVRAQEAYSLIVTGLLGTGAIGEEGILLPTK